MKERKIRITDTTAYSFFTYFANKNPNWESKVKQCMMSNFSGNNATKFGKDNELKPKICFESSYNVEVLKLGFIININCPWFGFSPDGFFKLNNQYILLEIKCPIKGSKFYGTDLLIQLKYIETKNNKLFLKKNHKFYAQIQFGLLLCNISKGLLVIYAKINNSISVIDVPFDKDYCKNLFDRLTNIYFEHIISNLINLVK